MNAHPVPAEWAARALINAESYAAKSERAIADPEAFWREETARIDWIKPWKTVLDWKPPHAKWFTGGKISGSNGSISYV